MKKVDKKSEEWNVRYIVTGEEGSISIYVFELDGSLDLC